MRALSDDTALEIEHRQIEQWRQMTSAQKAALVSGLTHAAFELSRAGVRHRHPEASPRELFLRLAIVVLGPALARKAYPDTVTLDAPSLDAALDDA